MSHRKFSFNFRSKALIFVQSSSMLAHKSSTNDDGSPAAESMIETEAS